jgi:hypothetical protein
MAWQSQRGGAAVALEEEHKVFLAEMQIEGLKRKRNPR